MAAVQNKQADKAEAVDIVRVVAGSIQLAVGSMAA